MTKQEAIKEGIIKRLNEFRWELQKPNALINTDTLTILQGAFADQILKDEDSQGVVIKEGELPCIRCKGSGEILKKIERYLGEGYWTRISCPKCKGIGIEAGYVAVKSLIKEEE